MKKKEINRTKVAQAAIDFFIPETSFGESSTGVFSLEGELASCSTEDLHYHSCHQFLRIRSGITLLVETGRQQPLFSNMTAFIPAGRPHRSIVMGQPVTYKSIYMEKLIFQPESDTDEIIIFDMSRLGRALFDRISLNGTAFEYADERGDDKNINGAEDHNEKNYGDAVQRHCFSLWLLLMKSEMQNHSWVTRIPVPTQPDNQKITAFIETHFQKKLTLADVASVVNYSPRHVARRFREDLGLTLFEYLRLYRIFRAAILLSDIHCSDMTITRIALSCGYDALSSFFKDFKSLFGMPPRQFRLTVGQSNGGAKLGGI